MPSPIGIVASGSGTVAAFSPTDIAGLQLWLDAADAATFTFSSGTVVSQWNDKSGNTRHVAQGTVARQPDRSGSQNSKATVVFDGAGVNADGLASAPITLAQAVTVFMVLKYDDADTNNRQALGNGNTTPTIYTTGGIWAIYAGTNLSSGVSDDANYHYMTAVFDGGSSSLRKDGTQIASGNIGANGWSTKRIPIGYDGPDASDGSAWDGAIGEVIIYSTSLGTTDRNSVEAYLAAKWAI